jgi:transposase
LLDKLYPHRAAIEAALVLRERSLFNLDTTVYLYDLTSTYFEGLCAANGKAKLGHSRDKRSDCKQVVVGLVVNRDGFPITHEVFAGNARDYATLATMLDRLTERLASKKVPPW